MEKAHVIKSKNELYTDEIICCKYGIINHPKKVNFNPHTHDFCEILFVKKGNLIYSVKGKQYRIKPGDLIISRPSEIHCISPVTDDVYERYDIIYDEKKLPFDIWERIPKNLDVIHHLNSPYILNIFEKIDYYTSKLTDLELKLVLVSLVNELFVNIILELEKSKTADQYVQTNDIVYQAVSYIEKNLLNIKSVEEIANSLYITKSHLHHTFVTYMGITPKKYINIKKLSLIQREIATGSKPTDIYEKYGFSDYSTFYRAYKKHYNRPPSVKNQVEPINSHGTEY